MPAATLKITLIAYTPEPEAVIATAARGRAGGESD